MIQSDSIYAWNPQVACRTLEETAFILHESKMMSLNEVGTFIWEQFKTPISLQRVVDAVVEEFDTTPETASRDVHLFCEQLLNRQLLAETKPVPD